MTIHQAWYLVMGKPDIPDSKVHGANMGPPGSCRPQIGPMLAPWTLLSWMVGTTSWYGHAFRITDPFVRRNQQWRVDSDHNGSVMRGFKFASLLVWTSLWTNSRVAHGLRRYDANVISQYLLLVIFKMLPSLNGFILQNKKMLMVSQRKLHGYVAERKGATYLSDIEYRQYHTCGYHQNPYSHVWTNCTWTKFVHIGMYIPNMRNINLYQKGKWCLSICIYIYTTNYIQKKI